MSNIDKSTEQINPNYLIYKYTKENVQRVIPTFPDEESALKIITLEERVTNLELLIEELINKN